MNELRECPQCASSDDYGTFQHTDGSEVWVCGVCAYDTEHGRTTKQCPGRCGTWIAPDLLCCDPCWARIPTRVPGFDEPWRGARIKARRVRSWSSFERATEAARSWLTSHPSSKGGTRRNEE